MEYLQFHRRQLHVQNPIKGGIRKQYGSTVSLGMSRGSIVIYKDKLYYLGGSSKGKISIHSIVTGERIKYNVNVEEIKRLYTQSRRVQFLPFQKEWVSLHKLG